MIVDLISWFWGGQKWCMWHEHLCFFSGLDTIILVGFSSIAFNSVSNCFLYCNLTLYLVYIFIHICLFFDYTMTMKKTTTLTVMMIRCSCDLFSCACGFIILLCVCRALLRAPNRKYKSSTRQLGPPLQIECIHVFIPDDLNKSKLYFAGTDPKQDVHPDIFKQNSGNTFNIFWK